MISGFYHFGCHQNKKASTYVEAFSLSTGGETRTPTPRGTRS